jgi:hypothetical protein
MSTLLAFVAGFTWGACVTILVFWGLSVTDSLDEHWDDNAALFEDDDQ